LIIGVGIDVAEVARYHFDEIKLARFAKKIYTEAEMTHAMKHRHFAERLAGAFAAKEATRKAFGHAIPWRLMGVRHERSGKPYMELLGRASALPALRGVRRMHVTITHTKSTAVAVVILEGDEPQAVVSAEVAAR
jgi:holo-[acyl-carrier protein] synthase